MFSCKTDMNILLIKEDVLSTILHPFSFSSKKKNNPKKMPPARSCSLPWSSFQASCQKSSEPIFFYQPPIARRVNLGGLIFKRAVFPIGCAELGPLSQRTMAEMVRTEAFRSRDAGEDGFSETKAILRKGSSEFGADVGFNGWESALNRSSKWLVAVLFSGVIIWKHDAEAMWAVIGSAINNFLAMVLKHLLNHQRPVSAPRSDPGMPSSHATSIFYATGFVVLSLIQWLGISPLSITLAALALSCGSYLSWLRVSQRLHTINQVFVGSVLGSLCSIIWFWLWKAFVLQAYISFLWVRIIMVIGAAGFCISFLLYVVRHWPLDSH